MMTYKSAIASKAQCSQPACDTTLKSWLTDKHRALVALICMVPLACALLPMEGFAKEPGNSSSAHDKHCEPCERGHDRGDRCKDHSQYTVGGTVSGLVGSGLTLRDNGNDDLSIAANGAFVFHRKLLEGSGYSVAIAASPTQPAQSCSVSQGIGTVGRHDVTSVVVACQSTPLTVASSSPANGSTDVLVSVLPAVSFSASLNPSTVTLANVTLSGPSGTLPIKVSTSAASITVTPVSALQPNTTYTLVIGTGVHGSSGEHLASPVTLKFTTGAAWTTLIGRSTTLGANLESYECTRIVAPTDMNITAFRTSANSGLRLAFVTVGPATSPVGNFDCTLSVALQRTSRPIYASATGTDAIAFPSGFAIHVQAGQAVTAIFDIVNDTSSALTGDDEILVQTAPDNQITTSAEMILLGKSYFELPGTLAGTTPVPQPITFQASFLYDRQLLALLPLMRTEGIHQRVSLVTETANAEQRNAILDTDFDPLHQVFHPLSMVFVNPGIVAGEEFPFPRISVQVDCTFVNSRPNEVDFGESATDELCLSGLYLSPSHDELFGSGFDGAAF
jgi:hypothetical protein